MIVDALTISAVLIAVVVIVTVISVMRSRKSANK
jgi:hypothetical protein